MRWSNEDDLLVVIPAVLLTVAALMGVFVLCAFFYTAGVRDGERVTAAEYRADAAEAQLAQAGQPVSPLVRQGDEMKGWARASKVEVEMFEDGSGIITLDGNVVGYIDGDGR